LIEDLRTHDVSARVPDSGRHVEASLAPPWLGDASWKRKAVTGSQLACLNDLEFGIDAEPDEVVIASHRDTAPVTGSNAPHSLR
jgi:hypothetical protein